MTKVNPSNKLLQIVCLCLCPFSSVYCKIIEVSKWEIFVNWHNYSVHQEITSGYYDGYVHYLCSETMFHRVIGICGFLQDLGIDYTAAFVPTCFKIAPSQDHNSLFLTTLNPFPTFCLHQKLPTFIFVIVMQMA